MGASDFKLASMLAVQVLTVGILGYGLGMGAAASFGAMAAQRGNPPFLLPLELILGVFGLILMICLAAASLAIIKVSRLEPAIVFRG